MKDEYLNMKAENQVTDTEEMTPRKVLGLLVFLLSLIHIFLSTLNL